MQKINEAVIEKIKIDLNSGILFPLLDALKNDGTLDLEFRKDYISIYYRGGSIAKISPRVTGYKVDFNKNYCEHDSKSYELFSNEISGTLNINSTDQTLDFIKELPYRKILMDAYFTKKPNIERQYQQLITHENNNNNQSNFYICDMEIVDNNTDSRSDMLMVKRPDKKDYTNLEFYVVELKYNTGSIKKDSGIFDHFKKLSNVSSVDLEIMKENALLQIKYKYELGLSNFNYYVDKGFSYSKSGNNLNLILYITGFAKKYNTNLLKELKSIIDYQVESKSNINVFVYNSYLAGHLMYEDELIPLNDFYNKEIQQ